jgi:hypothetical protein
MSAASIGAAATAGAPWWAYVGASLVAGAAVLAAKLYSTSRRYRISMAIVEQGTSADIVRALAELNGQPE